MFDFLKKNNTKKDEVFQNFGTGKMIELTDVPDEVFAKKMMGDGYALELTDGKIVAPFSGELVTVFPTGHAYGLKCDNGLEILIHLGIDTVELNGKGFDVKVKQGQRVSQGDTLCMMDLAAIEEAGKPTTSPLIFTSGQSVKLLKVNEPVTIKEEKILELQ